MITSMLTRQLSEKLGPAAVIADQDEIAPWLTDWRGIYHGSAQAVVRPVSTEDVALCVKLCNEANVPVVPRGGNTGLCGGATPDSNPANVVLSLDRMNAIRNMDVVGNTIVAEAGCILGNLRRVAADHNRLFPISLAAEDSCQLGGNLSTNAGGVHVVRYGMTRELVLGVEAVMPDGEIFDGLRTLRKDNTGYDIKQLLIGAEGTLGVITAASLRLFPVCNAKVVVLAAVASPTQALSLFSLLFERTGSRLQAFEYFTTNCLDLVLANCEGVRAPFPDVHPGYVLMELADTDNEAALRELVETVISDAIERDLCVDAAISESLSQVRSMWRLREEISEAQRADGPHLKHDVSLPISLIPDFFDSVEKKLQRVCPGLRTVVFGHFGDGNIHYNLSRPLDSPKDFFASCAEELTSVVLEEVAQRGGSISAEHGIGQLKREYLSRYKAPIDLRLMRAIKQALDPNGLMNPGKVL